MAFPAIDKTFSKAWFRNYAFIVIGALAMATGYVFIITEKYDEVRESIIYKLNRGGTALYAEGLFREDQKKMIFVNVGRRELVILESLIREIDPNAFFTVINTHEIIGKGFKPISGE